MILSAQSIRKSKMIEPFFERTEARYNFFHMRSLRQQLNEVTLSYGLGPCSYDLRLAQDVKLEVGVMTLASTIEKLTIPNDIAGRVMDKSSWARRGITVQNTHFDPGFIGHLTLEICNHTARPMVLTKGMPICQLVFEKLDEPTEIPYRGKYQNQEAGPVEAR